MSGPTGIQGRQGVKGSRGEKGIGGWGYGTTTGPTGGIGKSPVSVINTTNQTSTVLSISNSGTLFRIADLNYTPFPYQNVGIDITGLTGEPSGIFWIFNNNSKFGVILGAYSGGNFVDYLTSIDTNDSVTCVWNGTSITFI
jgi:hypothetical protein